MQNIAHEVGPLLSSFFQGQDALEKDHEKTQAEAKEAAKQGKAKNATAQAIDNVLRIRQIRQYYKDLEHMVRYELAMPDLWTEIKEERDRLVEEQKEIERLQKLAEDQAQAKKQFRLQQLKQKMHIYVALALAKATVIIVIVLLMWLVSADREWRWGY